VALGLVAGSVAEAQLLGRGPDVAGDVVHRVVGHFRAAAGESTPSGPELEQQGEPEAVAVAPLCDQSRVRIVEEEEPFQFWQRGLASEAAVGLVTGVKSPMEEADRGLDKRASPWLSTTSTADRRPRTERRT
jgi:hypothetical protein